MRIGRVGRQLRGEDSSRQLDDGRVARCRPSEPLASRYDQPVDRVGLAVTALEMILENSRPALVPTSRMSLSKIISRPGWSPRSPPASSRRSAGSSSRRVDRRPRPLRRSVALVRVRLARPRQRRPAARAY